MDRLRNFGFLLKEVTQRYTLRFEQLARLISLTLVQCKALAYLEKNQGVSQAKLAELAGVEAMTMVRILDRMEADGVIERRSDPADRRARCLYLTAAANPLLEEIWRLAELTRSEIFAGISPHDREIFMDILEHMHSNVCARDDRPVKGAPPSVGTLPDAAGSRSARKNRVSA